MSIKRIKPIVRIIIVIAICVVLYIIVFHVPRPVMFASETIVFHGSGTVESHDEDGNLLYSFSYGSNETLVRGNDSSFVAVINENDLTEILRNTKSFRELNAPQYYYVDDVIYQIDITTNKGPLNVFIGHEKSFWYRSGDTVFRYVIPDGQTLYERISAVLS